MDLNEFQNEEENEKVLPVKEARSLNDNQEKIFLE